MTYVIPQVLVLLRGRKAALKDHYFDLGKSGYVVNLLSPMLVLFLTVLICFPPELPVTVSNMNYTSVVIVLISAIMIALWKIIGQRFSGPQTEQAKLPDAK